MTACIVIPARHASARYPGKPLAPLRGAYGRARSLLERTVLAGQATGLPVLVATEDARIMAEARRIGVDCIATSESCRNGTERVAEAVARAGIGAPIIVNLQGDAPLTPPHFITALVEAMLQEPDCAVATPALRCGADTLRNLLADRAAGRVGATTVVCDRSGNALYFSKEVLPFGAGRADAAAAPPVFHHVGLYAYRPQALAHYATLSPGPLETAEGLEQLRFLEHGIPVRVVPVQAPGAVFWELNNPSDVPLIEAELLRAKVD